ncbi:MAG: CvpA family protein [Betaproteobacteria bacterium]|jgi:membrane protein required for colicin V production|nr:CvpA family protein [Betaproteobacteria bacterium]
MTTLDYAVIGVLLVSVIWSMLRGVVRELISLGGWIIAFLAANLFAGPLAAHLPQAVPGEAMRVLVGFVTVFVVVLIVSSLVGLLLSKLMKVVGLGAMDKALGALFGLARGLIIVLAAALLAGLTSAPRMPFWKDSASGEPLVRAALLLKPWLPDSLAQRLRYD